MPNNQEQMPVYSKLAFSNISNGEVQFVFLHGLLGRGRNWRAVAKTLGDHGFATTVVDLPNFGASGWTMRFSYEEIADIVADFLAKPVILVGHSMGGKVAMMTAFRHPEKILGLVVIDISPKKYSQSDTELIAAMDALDLTNIRSRADADKALQPNVSEFEARQLALQNLRRIGDHYRWEPNIDMLIENLDVIRDWPQLNGSYNGQILWLVGADSPYVIDSDQAIMHELFPGVRRVTVPNAGHLIHVDQPGRIVSELEQYAHRLLTASRQ